MVWGARTLQGDDRLAVGVEIRAGPPDGAVHRGEPLSRHAVGRVRAERRAALGADPPQRRRLHAEPVPPGRVPGHDAAGRLLREVRQARPPRRTTSTCGIVNILVGFAPLSRPSSSSSRSSRWPGRSRGLAIDGVASWPQFSVNAQRFDPYKNFKFRVKWDGRYVAGVSKVGALKRTTEVVKHREGGDPSSSRKSPGRTEVRRDHARARRHPRHRVREVGEQGLELRHRARRGSLAARTSARTSSSRSTTRPGQLALAYKVYRCWVSEFQALPDLDANANAVAIQHIKLENEGWERDYEVAEPSEPSFVEPA